MTTPTDPSHPAAPSVREIAALAARLREVTTRGRDVDPAERAAFLADKDALIARITDAGADDRLRGRARLEAKEALAEAVLARAEGSGYVLVGPSASTWLRDPTTGQPTTPVSEAEHRAVRELLGRDTLDATEPEWVTSPDGRPEVHSTVVLTVDHTDTADDAERAFDELCDGDWVTDVAADTDDEHDARARALGFRDAQSRRATAAALDRSGSGSDMARAGLGAQPHPAPEQPPMTTTSNKHHTEAAATAATADNPPIYDRPVSPDARQLDVASDVGQMTDDQYEAWYRDCFEPHEDDDGDGHYAADGR